MNPTVIAAEPPGLVFAEEDEATILLSLDEGESDSFPGILRLAFTFGLSIGSKFAKLALLLFDDDLLQLLPLLLIDPLVFNP